MISLAVFQDSRGYKVSGEKFEQKLSFAEPKQDREPDDGKVAARDREQARRHAAKPSMSTCIRFEC
jgi:hypothetical protein